MAEAAFVVDASPLIVLAKVGRLALLEALATTLLIPDAVAREVLGGPPGDPAHMALESGFASRHATEDLPHSVVEWSLGAGETSVIAACLALPGATAVLDDAEARACARTLGVPLIGTLGVVARARALELIPSAGTVFAELRAAGLFVDDATITSILRQLGEST